MALDWDVRNEDCSDISDWTDADDAGCTSSQVTFGGKSCFKFDAPAAAGNGAIAYRWDAFSIPDTFTLEASIYFDNEHDEGPLSIGIYTNSGHMYYLYPGWAGGITAPDNKCGFRGPSSGSAPHFYTGNLEGGWHTYRFVVKSSRKIDIWIDDRCFVANYTGSATSGTMGYVLLYATTDGVSDSISYLDYLKMDTTPEAPIAISPFKINNEEIVVRPAQTHVNHYTQDKLRIYGPLYTGKANAALGIPIVGTNDANASKSRIYDGSSVKSLMKLPS